MHPHLYKHHSIMSRIILLLFIDASIKKMFTGFTNELVGVTARDKRHK